MAVLRVNATRDGRLYGPSGASWQSDLCEALADVPRSAPVTILIHGFKFDACPETASGCHDPQRLLYRCGRVAPSRHRRPRSAAWAGALGFTERNPADGLAIGLGWSARTSRSAALRHERRNDFSLIYDRALVAGQALGRLVAEIATIDPGRRVHLFAHSLGARVALEAMRWAPQEAMGRLIFLGAAEFAGTTRAAMAGVAGPEVINVISRRNDLYDTLFATFAPRPPQRGDRPLGVAGLGERREDWVDLQIDHPEVIAWAQRRGFAVDPGRWQISHWSFYADAGAMALYRAVLRGAPGFASIAALRQGGIPEALEPRWVRLAPRSTALLAQARRFLAPGTRRADPAAESQTGEIPGM